MIADDDAGIVYAVEMMLEFEGYRVSSTIEWGTVLELQEEFPDLFFQISGCLFRMVERSGIST